MSSEPSWWWWVIAAFVGLAHLHHARERVVRGTHTWSASLCQAMVQNAYTVRITIQFLCQSPT